MKEQLRYKYKIKRRYFQHSAREVDTHGLIKALLAAGKEVFLPRVEGSEIVPVQYFGGESALVKNSYGIFEPAGDGYEGGIDVCITPLLAVNSRGYRLGYGGGYYDRFFGRTAF